MIYTVLDNTSRSVFMLPFFLGAAASSMFGGFFSLVLCFTVVVLSFKLIKRVCQDQPTGQQCP